MIGCYRVGNRQACRCVKLHQSMYFYRSGMNPLTALRVRFGYRRIYMLLRREGWDVGKDRFYRAYCEENLGLRRKRPWHYVSAVHRVATISTGF
jgi:putative transposase